MILTGRKEVGKAQGTCRMKKVGQQKGGQFGGEKQKWSERVQTFVPLVTKITLCNKNDSKFPAADAGSDGGAVDNGASLSPLSPPFRRHPHSLSFFLSLSYSFPLSSPLLQKPHYPIPKGSSLPFTLLSFLCAVATTPIFRFKVLPHHYHHHHRRQRNTNR